MARIYTRQGAIETNPGGIDTGYKKRDYNIRTYRFPLKNDSSLEIRLNIPDGATKEDMLEAVEHMRVCADFME